MGRDAVEGSTLGPAPVRFPGIPHVRNVGDVRSGEDPGVRRRLRSGGVIHPLPLGGIGGSFGIGVRGRRADEVHGGPLSDWNPVSELAGSAELESRYPVEAGLEVSRGGAVWLLRLLRLLVDHGDRLFFVHFSPNRSMETVFPQ